MSNVPNPSLAKTKICPKRFEDVHYECVNDIEFFNRLKPLMPTSGMIYLTDHSDTLQERRGGMHPEWVFIEPGEFAIRDDFHFKFVHNYSEPDHNYGLLNRGSEFRVKNVG